MYLDDYIALPTWENVYKHPTMKQMYQIVHDNESLHHAVKVIGGDVWIDQQKFWDWVSKETKNSKSSAENNLSVIERHYKDNNLSDVIVYCDYCKRKY